ncbi:MAG TPA: carbon starvation protein A [Lentisphaeria bacterium]|nr:MAG: carbon starvation protein CstA [Lentisphaerae bacterium GWF2_38_69]HBM17233.1 carbon starvation protein A [Lentisphaeria bacterium]
MPSIVFVIVALLVFALAYRFYSAFIAAKVLILDHDRPTPAVKYRDDFDYSPTNKIVLFGQHFAAIAGAGPLIGPVLAAQYGFLPGYLWILIGAVFAGAVHDMVMLFISIRFDGKSISAIAGEYMNKHVGFVTSLAVLIILIISMAGLGIPVVNALYHSPWGVFSVGVTIPIAMFVGIYLKYFRTNRITEGTIIGVALICLGVFVGPFIAESFIAPYLNLDVQNLSLILPVYGFLAASLPVWLLLVPRDYLSSYMKIGVMIALAVGVIILHPEIKMPMITKFVNGGGPIIPGKVWPFLFITIACGALSGFHSIIASGTTCKLLATEKDLRLIGYGAMIFEGFVAIMALIAATVLPSADYFAINTVPEVFAKLGMVQEHVGMISNMVQEDLTGRPGGAVSLAAGMIYVFHKLKYLDFLMPYFYHFLILFEALFILTTIDAGTRAGRFLLDNILVKAKILKDKQKQSISRIIILSILLSLTWGYLLYTGHVSTIWPLFGIANQMLASIALALGTTYIISTGKLKYALITLLPWIFVTITTLDAAISSILDNYLPSGNNILAGMAAALIIMVVIISIDSILSWIKKAKENYFRQQASFWND